MGDPKAAKKDFVAPEEMQRTIDHRIKMFEEIWGKQEEERKEKVALNEPIKIKLPLKPGEDEEKRVVKDGVAFQTTPHDIACLISNRLGKHALVAKVDGNWWDLHRPLETDCELKILDFRSDEGKEVFWHSSSHILGESLELMYGGKLTIGPALKEAFYYDVALEDGKVISSKDFKNIEQFYTQIVAQAQDFKRIVLTKKEALEMFKFNKYKQQLIKEKIVDGAICTVYRCGPLIDLCRGPHIPNTKRVKACAITKNSAVYWKADAKNDSLQRVYGVSFPDKKMMKKYQKKVKLAEERNHKKIGTRQKLFFFDTDLSPGSCFWLPHGARIYNKLVEHLRKIYKIRGYSEVITPNMCNIKLWEQSGHAKKYKENMFLLDVEGQEWGLKPMNCPMHCLMFKHTNRSYRELPLRLADFGALHRNELSGALHGLTRVRRFQQDDAHIFCTIDQLKEEISGCLQFLKLIYGIFDFKFKLALSTRPDNFMGEISLWDKAESMLEKCLVEFAGRDWTINAKDGAFYGPKIDVTLLDCMDREHQCGTIQVDFQLPRRFELGYVDQEAKEQFPVIVHRAIYGSLERFIAILIEHCGGKWPLWLSPRQIIVIPVSEKFSVYAEQVQKKCIKAGFYCDLDSSANTLPKKIRNAQLEQYNAFFVVGEKEAADGSVTVRRRDSKKMEKSSLPQVLKVLQDECDPDQLSDTCVIS